MRIDGLHQFPHAQGVLIFSLGRVLSNGQGRIRVGDLVGVPQRGILWYPHSHHSSQPSLAKPALPIFEHDRLDRVFSIIKPHIIVFVLTLLQGSFELWYLLVPSSATATLSSASPSLTFAVAFYCLAFAQALLAPLARASAFLTAVTFSFTVALTTSFKALSLSASSAASFSLSSMVWASYVAYFGSVSTCLKNVRIK